MCFLSWGFLLDVCERLLSIRRVTRGILYAALCPKDAAAQMYLRTWEGQVCRDLGRCSNVTCASLHLIWNQVIIWDLDDSGASCLKHVWKMFHICLPPPPHQSVVLQNKLSTSHNSLPSYWPSRFWVSVALLAWAKHWFQWRRQGHFGRTYRTWPNWAKKVFRNPWESAA